MNGSSFAPNSVIQEWRPSHGFVGNCTFESAIKKQESKLEGAIGAKREKVQSLIEHFVGHIVEKNHLHHPIVKEIKDVLSDLFGNDATIQIYSAGNHNLPLKLTPGKLVRSDQGSKAKESKDAIVNDAYDITHTSIQFYQDVHNVKLNQLLGSIDKPLPLSSEVHYQGAHGTRGALDNAFWDPSISRMVYGDGRAFNPLVTEPTVGVHEISHFVTQETGGTAVSQNGQPTGLDYTGDAGGLNEYNSDAAAVAAIQKQANQMNPHDASFLIGHGLLVSNPKASLRDMRNPGYGYEDDKILGDDPQKGYGDYRNWFHDSENTDPHLSSAVGNKWYAYTADLIDMPTWQSVELIRYQALPKCKPNCLYPEYAQITMDEAKKLFPHTDKIWQQVGYGWKEVGVLV